MHYSDDLRIILEGVLMVSTNKRLSCSEIMEHPIFKSRSLKYYPESFTDKLQYSEEPTQNSFLLKTIKFPKNLSTLTN